VGGDGQDVIFLYHASIKMACFIALPRLGSSWPNSVKTRLQNRLGVMQQQLQAA